MAGACAAPEGAEPGGPIAGPGVEPADSAIVVEVDDDSPEGVALAAVEQAWIDGSYREAVRLTDSLDAAWGRDPAVPGGPVQRLARLLLAQGEDVRAVDQLLYHTEAIDESWRGEIRRAAGRMSIAELDGLSRRISRDEEAMGIVRAEHAWALARSGALDQAREAARRLDDAELADADREKVEDVLEDGRVPPPDRRIEIAFVVPRSGPFTPVGDELIEGARLAASRWETELGVPIELRVIDEMAAIDSTDVFLSSFLGEETFRRPDTARVRERFVDAQGNPVLQPGTVGGAAPAPRVALAAVIGPVRSEALRAAARQRARPGLLLVSPTASEDSALAPHAYSLWDRASRDSLEATALASWLVSAFEPRRVGALVPGDSIGEGPARVGALVPNDDSGARRARILRAIVDSAGYEWAGTETYAADSTTYERQIRRLAAADPDYVYAVADGPRQVLQVAPQLHFYGLRGRITLVNQDWTHPTVLRRLDEPFSDYRAAAVYFARDDNDEYRRFASDWDEEYRRSLPANAFAALGYDAVSLVASSIPDPTLIRPAAIARAVGRTETFRGVTGTFRFDPATGRLERDADVWMILNSELVEPDPRAMLDWSIEAREQEMRRLDQEAEDEARRRGDP